jgi:hypothetical protein
MVPHVHVERSKAVMSLQLTWPLGVHVTAQRSSSGGL